MDWLLDYDRETAQAARERLLAETIDVARFVAGYIESYPDLPQDLLRTGAN
jgi:hypothetical protein